MKCDEVTHHHITKPIWIHDHKILILEIDHSPTSCKDIAIATCGFSFDYPQFTNHANLVIPREQYHFQTLLLLHVVLNLIILQPPNFVDLVLPCEQCHFAMLSLSQWVCKDVFNSI